MRDDASRAEGGEAKDAERAVCMEYSAGNATRGQVPGLHAAVRQSVEEHVVEGQAKDEEGEFGQGRGKGWVRDARVRGRETTEGRRRQRRERNNLFVCLYACEAER